MSRAGLTTRDVGRAVKLDHSAVARWLKGTKPYPSSVANLAAYFNVPVDVLLDDSRDLPFQHVHEQANARDHQDATVTKGPIDGPIDEMDPEEAAALNAIARPKGVDAKFRVGVAQALAQQLREIADQIEQLDPQKAKQIEAAKAHLAKLKAQVDAEMAASRPRDPKGHRHAS